MNDLSQAAWQRADNFIEKPAGAPYGFIVNKQPHGCIDFQDFRQKLHGHDSLSSVYYVWTPDSPNLVLIGEVEGLLDIVKPMKEEVAARRFKAAQKKLLLGVALIIGYLAMNYRYLTQGFLKSTNFGFLVVLFLIFALIPFYDAWKYRKKVKDLDETALKDEADEIRFDIWTHNQPVIFTKALLGIIIGIAVLQWMSTELAGYKYAFPETAHAAGLKKSLVFAGEGWRIWTAPFLHGGIFHIFMNASALWYLGRRVEVLTKWPHLLMSYLLSILGGSYASLYLNSGDAPSVGASGGIMGLLGFLLVFELLHPRLAPKPARKRLIGIIILMAVIGAVGAQFIDNAAHAGGLITGMLYGALGFRKSETIKRPVLTLLDKSIGVSAALILGVTAVFSVLKMCQWI